MIADAESFLVTWGKTADRAGWTALDLFGVHPTAPTARFDVMGLIPMLRSRAVITLTQDSAVIRGRSGAGLVYRRKPDSQAVLLTLTEC
jgi:hypothetical protein